MGQVISLSEFRKTRKVTTAPFFAPAFVLVFGRPIGVHSTVYGYKPELPKEEHNPYGAWIEEFADSKEAAEYVRKNTTEEVFYKQAVDFASIKEQNRRNEERLRKERMKANKKVKKSYRIKEKS